MPVLYTVSVLFPAATLDEEGGLDLHSTHVYDFLLASDGIGLDGADWG
jgi:hypothetical protein